jgi:septal ring factor EnvC (AmiA/AmiB activator)
VATADNAELKALRNAIESSRDRLERYERDHRGLLETLEAIDQSTEAMNADLGRRRRAERDARAELAETRDEIDEVRQRLAATRAALRRRALALYQAGEHGAMQVLFSATSIREILDRAHALRVLLNHDQRLIRRFRDERVALDALDVRGAAVAERRAQAVEELEVRRVAIKNERATKHALLDGIRGDRARERSALAELERAARALEETLDRLDRSARTVSSIREGAFESQSGSLPRPVEGGIAREFGRSTDDEFHTQLFHKGVDFAAALGTPVHSVAPGRVRFAGWFRGYGRLIIIDHGDRYFTVSGHLEQIEVAVGDDVLAHESIGSVGESGSLIGPRLYFEIRRGDEALDPADWLEP